MATKVFTDATIDFTSATTGFGSPPAWTAAAAAWAPSMNGDTGVVSDAGMGGANAILLNVNGTLHDDGSIPATILISSINISFDWAVTHVGGSASPRSTLQPGCTNTGANFNQGAGASSGTTSVLWNGTALTGVSSPTRADLFALGFQYFLNLEDNTTTSTRFVVSNYTVTVVYQNIGVGSWLVRCGQMNTATGAVDFVSAFPDAAQISGTPGATGTIQIPFADTAGAFIYVDGSVTPVDIAGLPAGFTLSSAYALHYHTFAGGAAVQVEYHYGAVFDPTLVGSAMPATDPNGLSFNGGDFETTGMDLTTLGALVGTHILATLTSDGSGNLIFVENDTAYDAYNTMALIGTYTILSPAVILVIPASGTILGGTPVTVRGRGFLSATNVKFDGVLATEMVIVSDTKITCITPPHATGLVDVQVVGVATGTGLYTYVARQPITLPPVPVTVPTRQGATPATSGKGDGDERMHEVWVKWFEAVKVAIENNSK